MTTLNRDAYAKLIQQDIDALPADMPKLEREHIVDVLKHSIAAYYDNPPAVEIKGILKTKILDKPGPGAVLISNDAYHTLADWLKTEPNAGN